MGYRTQVLTKYEIEYGTTIGNNYGQEEIREALEKLREVGEYEFYVTDSYDYPMESLYIYEEFVTVYDKLMADKETYINEIGFTEEELEVLKQIYDLFHMEPRPEYLDKKGYLFFMSL